MVQFNAQVERPYHQSRASLKVKSIRRLPAALGWLLCFPPVVAEAVATISGTGEVSNSFSRRHRRHRGGQPRQRCLQCQGVLWLGDVTRSVTQVSGPAAT